jgi:predicted  nucleic acid-binding Zn-ribbon protein
MHPDIPLVIQLQSLDQRLSEAQREIDALPKLLAQAEKALDSHLRKLEADRAATAANQNERKQLEGEVQVQQQKISKFKDQMLEARTNEQYRAFQNEIDYCQKEIEKAEDRLLDLMSEYEPLDQNVKAAEAALQQEQQQVSAEQQRVRQRCEADRQLLSKLKQERQQLVARIAPKVYKSYERLRRKWVDICVTEAADERCLACHLTLRPQFFQDLKLSEQVMFCESCGRILYYIPPVAVEDDGGTPSAVGQA